MVYAHTSKAVNSEEIILPHTGTYGTFSCDSQCEEKEYYFKALCHCTLLLCTI